MNLNLWLIFYWIVCFLILYRQVVVRVGDKFSVGILVCKNFFHSEVCLFLPLMVCHLHLLIPFVYLS